MGTGPEPGKAASPPTTRRRGRKARTMSHRYSLKGKGKQEDRRRPGTTRKSIKAPKETKGKRKGKVKENKERRGKSYQEEGTSKGETQNEKRKKTEIQYMGCIPVKYKKRKTALPTGKKKIAGAKGGREQVKTKTHKDEAENRVSKSAADASDRGGMQTRGGGRKHNTTGRWRTKGKKEGME